MANVAARLRALVPPGATVSARTRKSITFDLPDGRKRWIGSVAPIHYGVDQEIDTTWIADTGVWQWRMTAAGYEARSKSLFDGAPLFEYRVGTDWVTLQPRQLDWTNDRNDVQSAGAIAGVAATQTDNVLRWNGAFGAGRDFAFRCDADHLAKNVIINSYNSLPAPSAQVMGGANPVLRIQFTFTYASATLTPFVNGVDWIGAGRPATTTNQDIEFRRDDGSVAFVFAAPIAYSSGRNPGRPAVVLRISRSGPNLLVEVRVPQAWLETAVYPVIIDPTVNEVVGASADDAEQQSILSNAGRNVTGSGTVSITSNPLSPGSHGSNANRSIGCRFQTVNVPQGATIDSATFTLTGFADYGTGSVITFHVSAEDVDNATAFAATSGNLNAATRPRTTADAGPWDQDTVLGGQAHSVSVTAVVQEIIDRTGWAANNALSILIDTTTATTTGEWQEYRAQDDAGSGNEPKLDITYTAGTIESSATFVGAGTLSGGSPVFRASVTVIGSAVAVTNNPVFVTAASFAGVGTLSSSNPVFTASVTVVATATLAVTNPVFVATAALAGTSTLVAYAPTPFVGTFIITGRLGTIFSRLGLMSLAALGNVVDQAPSATFVGTSTLSVTPVFVSGVTINGTSTLATSNPVFTSAVTIVGSGTLQSTPVFQASITVIGSGVLSATPQLIAPAGATFAGTSVLTITPVFASSANFAGASTLEVTPVLSGPASATFVGAGVFSAGNPVFTTGFSTAGASSLTANGSRFLSAATTAGVGTLAANNPVFVASITGVGAGTLSATPTVSIPVSVAFAGSSTLTAVYEFSGPASGNFEGTSTLSATPHLLTPAAVSFVATASLVATPTLTTPSAVTLAGGAVASFGAVQIHGRSIAINGVGVLAPTPIQIYPGAATSVGVGTLSAIPINTIVTNTTLIGTGTLNAVPINTIVSGVAVNGSSLLTVDYNYGIYIFTSATFTGTSTFMILGYGYESARAAFATSSIQLTAYPVTRIQVTIYSASRAQKSAYASGYARRN